MSSVTGRGLKCCLVERNKIRTQHFFGMFSNRSQTDKLWTENNTLSYNIHRNSSRLNVLKSAVCKHCLKLFF
jgi:hypothetical protein